MKYKLYLGTDFDRGDLGDPYEVESKSDLDLEFRIEDFCQHLYSNCDGWEWMRNRRDCSIVAVGPNNNIKRFVYELDFEPTFLILATGDQQ